MTFFEHRMNECLSFGARGGPVFSTSKAFSSSGRRAANKNWASPLHRYDLTHAIRNEEAFHEVRNFFYVVSGSFDGFRLKDHQDYKDGGNGVMTLVSGATYQMRKNYPLGARTYVRAIQKPVSGAQILRTRSGTTTNITGTSTIDFTTGQVIVAGHAGGDTYKWTGEFDVPVAFTSDEFMSTIVSRAGEDFLILGPSIEVEEIRL